MLDWQINNNWNDYLDFFNQNKKDIYFTEEYINPPWEHFYYYPIWQGAMADYPEFDPGTPANPEDFVLE